MNNFGFGFRNSDDDSDDERRKNNKDNHKDDADKNAGNNPFGFFFGMPTGSTSSGGLGEILNQFGTMLSGLGTDLGTNDGHAVNYSMVERIATQQFPRTSRPETNDSHAVAESVRLAELWLDEATILPAGATGSVAFGPQQWIEETLPTWKRLLTPLAKKLGEANLNAIPEDMRGSLGPMEAIMRQVNSVNFSMQLGKTLGELARDAILSTQWGIPLAQGRVAAIATAHLDDMASKLGVDKREALIYLSARETAHHRLFQHVPWLVERLILDVEEFAAGMSLDYSAMEEATREFNPEMMNNPSALQDMIGRLQGEDLSPRVVSTNAHARQRLETSLSLVEGWVDYVVDSALGPRMPHTPMAGAAWENFRSKPSPALDGLTTALGLSLRAPKAAEAADLWRRLDQAVGTEARDGVWDHADFLPLSEDLDNPAAYISHIAFDSEEMKDFNPISEIERLERESRTPDDDGTNGSSSDSTDDGENPTGT